MNKPRWTIKLGREGTADCTLILVNPDGHEKEALIESEAWRIMCTVPRGQEVTYIYTHTEEGNANSWADILRLVWDHAKFD